MKDNPEQLKKVVEQLHNCSAQFIESVLVKETFKGKIIWEGTVFVYALADNSQANKCYAWSSPIEGSTKRRYYAVLHIPPVDSAEKAVRAAIVQDFKAEKPEKKN